MSSPNGHVPATTLMSLETFAQRVRFARQDRFVLWQAVFEPPVESRVLRDDAGRIPVFTTPESASTYAATRGITLSSYPPGVDITHDLDAIALWAATPEAATLDPVAIVSTWMFLEDAGVLPGMYDDDLDAELEHVVWQLDYAELAVRYPEQFARHTPTWTAVALTTLASTLRRGITEFGSLLTSSDTL